MYTLCVSFLSFQMQAQVTPCTANPLFYDTAQHIPVLMNEILPQGLSGETWIEFYNCREDTVDLGGWFLTDDPVDSLQYSIPSPYVISPQEFKVLSLSFTISRSFGLLQLWRPDSTMAYGMAFDGVRVGESVGFCGNMIKRQEPSPGFGNMCIDFETGIEKIFEGKDVQYYDLFGTQVHEIRQGLYICVQGGLRKKVFVVR